MQEFQGKVALVTGGGSGIGRGLALALATEGARVVVSDIGQSSAEQVATEIRDSGGEAMVIACDVSDRSAVRHMQAAVEAAYGPVTLLFANAGVTSYEAVTDMTHNDIDWVVGVNVFGVTNCLQAFLPGMRAAGEGHIVATASMAGLIPHWLGNHVPYTGAKAAAIAMISNLRAETAPYGIGCTVLCPGGVQTNIFETPRYRPERFGGPATGLVTPPASFIDSQNIVFKQPDEVAQMVLLAVRRNRFMVLTDSTRKGQFQEYVYEVMLTFDDAEKFDEKQLSLNGEAELTG